MATTFETLEEKRKLFNEFAAKVLPPELLNEDQPGFSEMARRISDPGNRKTFRELAIAMLEANIAHYRPSATKQAVPTSNSTFVVASTLILAGLVQYAFGTSAALVVAGLWYWIAGHAAARRVNELTRQVEEHNSEIAGWAETLRAWEAARDELQPFGP